MTSARKRYVLLATNRNLLPEDCKNLGRLLEQRHGRITVIPVEAIANRLIIKTNAVEASAMRHTVASMEVHGVNVVSLLTSGCIGKLKRRAAESTASDLAEVSQ
jgi:hypothetical protein